MEIRDKQQGSSPAQHIKELQEKVDFLASDYVDAMVINAICHDAPYRLSGQVNPSLDKLNGFRRACRRYYQETIRQLEQGSCPLQLKPGKDVVEITV